MEQPSDAGIEQATDADIEKPTNNVMGQPVVTRSEIGYEVLEKILNLKIERNETICILVAYRKASIFQVFKNIAKH